jgi:hypothetical protein
MVFIISMVYMTFSTHNVAKEYEAQLPKELIEVYGKIVAERTQIYYSGFILGVVLSMLAIYYNVKVKKTKMSTMGMVCMVVAISFITSYLYYTVSPKSDYMLNHIKDEKQTKAWLEMYRQMKTNYHIGFVLGIVAVGFFGFAFC